MPRFCMKWQGTVTFSLFWLYGSSCCRGTSTGKHGAIMWEKAGLIGLKTYENQIRFLFLAFWFNIGRPSPHYVTALTAPIDSTDWIQLNLLPASISSPKVPECFSGPAKSTMAHDVIPVMALNPRTSSQRKSEQQGSATPPVPSTATNNTQHKSSRKQPVNGQLTMTANPFTPKLMIHALVHNPFRRNLLAVKRCAKSRAPMQSLLCSKCG